MHAAHALEIVRKERFVERVVRMGGDEYSAARHADYDGRMVKVARCPAELNDIADFELI